MHRSTYYRWKRQVERSGLEMLRPRERRRPQMPNQLSEMVEQRIVAFALGHPGLGPRRVARELARAGMGRAASSRPTASRRCCCRHGLNTRAKRLALVAGYRAPYEPPREPEPEPHIDSDRPGELVGIDCFFVGRLHGTKGPVWQITAIDTYVSYRLGRPGRLPHQPARPSSTPRALARRVAAELQAAGWQLERVLSDNGNEFGAKPSTRRLPRRRPATPRSAPGARRPTATSNGCTARSSKNAGDPRSRATSKSATPACAATSTRYLHDYNHDREHHGRTPRPDDARPTSSTVPARWSRDEPHLSAQLGVCSA